MSRTLCDAKRLRDLVDNSRPARLALALVAAASVGLALTATAPAAAAEGQGGAAAPEGRPQPRLTAAVVSFAEPREYQRRAVGVRAAAWMQRLLEDAGRWQMAPRDRVLALERRMNMAPPYPAGELQRIGAKLMVHLVVSGAVGAVRMDYRKHSVELQVRVELTDVATGELLAAANGKGWAVAKKSEPEPTDVIVERALGKACRDACDRLLKPKQVVASVAGERGRNELVIAGGREVGLAKDRKCLVLRRSGQVFDTVAVVILSDVSDERAVGVVISAAKKPRAGDILVAP